MRKVLLSCMSFELFQQFLKMIREIYAEKLFLTSPLLAASCFSPERLLLISLLGLQESKGNSNSNSNTSVHLGGHIVTQVEKLHALMYLRCFNGFYTYLDRGTTLHRISKWPDPIPFELL